MADRERLTELINEKQVYGISQDQPRKRELLLLDNDDLAKHLLANGVIVLPCKMGTTVYRVCRKKFDVDGYGMQFIEDWGIVTNNFHLGMFYEIGKTVFLTREEAEAALAKMEV